MNFALRWCKRLSTFGQWEALFYTYSSHSLLCTQKELLLFNWDPFRMKLFFWFFPFLFVFSSCSLTCNFSLTLYTLRLLHCQLCTKFQWLSFHALAILSFSLALSLRACAQPKRMMRRHMTSHSAQSLRPFRPIHHISIPKCRHLVCGMREAHRFRRNFRRRCIQ